MERTKTILIICCVHEKEVVSTWARQNPEYTVIMDVFEEYAKDGLQKQIFDRIQKHKSGIERFDGVVGTNDVPSLVASILARELHLRGTSPESIIRTQNKYLSRLSQREIIPEYTPQFQLGSEIQSPEDVTLSFPLFTKPIVSKVSRYSYYVENYASLQNILSKASSVLNTQNELYRWSFEEIMRLGLINPIEMPSATSMICEELLYGDHISVDGWISDGKVGFFGKTDCILLPNNISFDRFDFPFHCSALLEDKIYQISEKVIKGAGLDNTLFCVEMKVREEDQMVSIIEINTRLTMQFVFLLEKATGINPLTQFVRIALGEDVADTPPKDFVLQKCASSCVLRKTSDAIVSEVPTKSYIDELESQFSNTQITSLVQPRRKLSDYPQDAFTYRYAFVDIARNSLSEILSEFKEIKQMLNFRFEECEVATLPPDKAEDLL
jgi:Carbamoyl-phosphate synthase L chain, ATP binding domain